MSALLFLYKSVLEDPLPWLHDLERAQRPQRLPVVLSVDEVRRVIDAVEEPSQLIVKLLYGSGLRLLEALTLRVKNIDVARGQVTVRDPEWKHDRVTMLASVSAELSEPLVRAAPLHQEDLAAGLGRRMSSIGNSRPPRVTAVGNGSFPPRPDGRARPPRAGITTTRRMSSAP